MASAYPQIETGLRLQQQDEYAVDRAGAAWIASVPIYLTNSIGPTGLALGRYIPILILKEDRP